MADFFWDLRGLPGARLDPGLSQRQPAGPHHVASLRVCRTMPKFAS